MGLLILNQYVDGLLQSININIKKGAQNEQEVCSMDIKNEHGKVIVAVAVDDFLATASSKVVMDIFYAFVVKLYRIKRQRRPTRYLG